MADPQPLAVSINWNRPTNSNGLHQMADFLKAKGRVKKAMPEGLAGQGDMYMSSMISEVVHSPVLLECTPISLFSCAFRAAHLGLKIGGPAGQAFLVPFKNNAKGVREAQLIVGWKGWAQMAQRSGMVKRLTPAVVRKGDEFSWAKGTTAYIRHIPTGDEDREPLWYYVVVETTVGGVDFEVFSQADAVRHRDRYSKAKTDSPWKDMTYGGNFEKMAMKTLVIRIAKRIPLSDQWNAAAVLDDQADTGLAQDHGELENIILAATEETEPPPAPEQPPQPEVVEDSTESLGRD